ncbi:MAG: hypothetical protein M3Y80_10435 [Verrucomicrobiota bacterium]|nr:hypothetical protein [Verrucomicrobiota bacterium]
MMKLNTGFGNYSWDGLAHLGETVATNLDNLPIFKGLLPATADIRAAAVELRKAIAMVGPGRKQALEAAFAVLAGLLGEVAVNAPQVKDVTDTDLAEIGLPQAKTRTAATSVPAAPQDLRLHHGEMPGEVTGSFKAPPGNNRIYEIQWTVNPSGA